MAMHSLNVKLVLPDGFDLDDIRQLATASGITLDELISRFVFEGSQRLASHLGDPETLAFFEAHRDGAPTNLTPENTRLD